MFKYVLSLCLLLLSGYHQLYADVQGDVVFNSRIQNLIDSAETDFDRLQKDDAPTFKPYTKGTKKKGDLTDITGFEEEEEEKDERERHSSRKLKQQSDYFTTCPYSHLPGDYFSYIKKSLPFLKHFSHLPYSSLTILLCVIRI